jgi:hypothetical protein
MDVSSRTFQKVLYGAKNKNSKVHSLLCHIFSKYSVLAFQRIVNCSCMYNDHCYGYFEFSEPPPFGFCVFIKGPIIMKKA